MSVVKDSFLDLERRRRQLEQTVADFRKLLVHWQTWEAEYEGLKEDIQSLGIDAPVQKIQAVAHEFEGELLTSKEISALLRDDKGAARDSKQIQGLLSRRIDYVQANSRTMQDKFDAAEAKLGAVNVVMQPEATDEEGLPLTEIVEELDDDDNVISSSIQRPGDVAPQIVEALRKQGITELPELEPSEQETSGSKPKKVTFAEQLDISKSAEPQPQSRSGHGAVEDDGRISDPELLSNGHGNNIYNIGDGSPILNPVIPSDETPDEVELRRQMLEYNMNDIGAIVAELDLEEDSGDQDDASDDDSDVDMIYDTDDEAEDRFGRTTRRIVSEDYRREMLELERRLNAKSMTNMGPNFVAATEPSAKTDLESDIKLTEEKKEVRFADKLDTNEIASSDTSKPVPNTVISNPLAETIVERSVSAEPANRDAKPKKVSAFKARKTGQVPSRAVSNGPLAGIESPGLVPAINSKKVPGPIPTSDYYTVPEGPPGRTLADTIIEKAVEPSSFKEPDEFDPDMMHQQAAVEYYKMRNKIIQRNGGFKAPDEDEVDPDGPRVSRFKAARLTKSMK